MHFQTRSWPFPVRNDGYLCGHFPRDSYFIGAHRISMFLFSCAINTLPGGNKEAWRRFRRVLSRTLLEKSRMINFQGCIECKFSSSFVVLYILSFSLYTCIFLYSILWSFATSYRSYRKKEEGRFLLFEEPRRFDLMVRKYSGTHNGIRNDTWQRFYDRAWEKINRV